MMTDQGNGQKTAPPPKNTAPSYTGPHTVKLKKWISCSPFEELLGINILEAHAGRSILTMPFVEKLAQGGGLLHGGAIVSLADTSVAMAVKSIVEEGQPVWHN